MMVPYELSNHVMDAEMDTFGLGIGLWPIAGSLQSSDSEPLGKFFHHGCGELCTPIGQYGGRHGRLDYDIFIQCRSHASAVLFLNGDSHRYRVAESITDRIY